MQVYQRDHATRAIWKCAGLLTAAIRSLHFAAIGAVTVIPDPLIEFQPSGLNRTLMAIAVAAVTFIVLLSALAAAVIHTSGIRCENALRDQNARFEEALRYLPVGLSMFDAEQRLVMCNAPYREIYDLSVRVYATRDVVLRDNAPSRPERDRAGRRGKPCDSAGVDYRALRRHSQWQAVHSARGGFGDSRTVIVKVRPIRSRRFRSTFRKTLPTRSPTGSQNCAYGAPRHVDGFARSPPAA